MTALSFPSLILICSMVKVILQLLFFIKLILFFVGARCPVQQNVFPALGRARSGDGLRADFNAFKIPESNMVVFEAKVRTCRRQCEPVSHVTNHFDVL